MYAKFASVFALASVAVAAPVPQLLGLPLSAIPILGGLLGDLPTLPSLPIIGSLTVPTDIPGLPVSIPAIPTSIDITIPVAVPTALPLGEGAPKADCNVPSCPRSFPQY
ncbi:hypothetical protein BC628DRAFT_1400946 [Trametes gibbosa]|nr:hypothetical protein BC628DRAFT_1400946 [Trametes gibbosa]